MDFLQAILTCSDDELDELLESRIKYLTEESINENGHYDVLGYELDINHQVYKDMFNKKNINFTIINNWIDYIPKGMKIVYGGELDGKIGWGSNMGRYFYMDSEEYLKDFCMFLREQKPKIEKPYDLVPLTFDFLYQYLGAFNLNPINRDTALNALLVDTNGRYYSPIREHNISNYKGIGAAVCTEYSALAANILCLFDFSTVFFCGRINNEDHNFLMAAYKQDEYSILDVAYGVDIYDEKGNFAGKAPFMELLDGFTEEDYDSFVYGDKHVELDEYCLIKSNGKMYAFYFNDDVRDYSVDGTPLEEKKPKIIV